MAGQRKAAPVLIYTASAPGTTPRYKCYVRATLANTEAGQRSDILAFSYTG